MSKRPLEFRSDRFLCDSQLFSILAGDCGLVSYSVSSFVRKGCYYLLHGIVHWLAIAV